MRKSLKLPYLNTVMIAGRLLADPRPASGDNGAVGATFKVAVNRYPKSRKPITTKIEVTCWGSLAEGANRKLQAGDAVLVSGSLQQDERQRGALYVAAAHLQFLDEEREGEAVGE